MSQLGRKQPPTSGNRAKRSAAQRAWSNGGVKNYDEPAEPTRWQLFLRELEMTDAQALEKVARRLDGWGQIRNWVRLHRTRVFVPEAVLLALRMDVREEEAGYVSRYELGLMGRRSAELCRQKKLGLRVAERLASGVSSS